MSLAVEILDRYKAEGRMIATAESCTGQQFYDERCAIHHVDQFSCVDR